MIGLFKRCSRSNSSLRLRACAVVFRVDLAHWQSAPCFSGPASVSSSTTRTRRHSDFIVSNLTRKRRFTIQPRTSSFAPTVAGRRCEASQTTATLCVPAQMAFRLLSSPLWPGPAILSRYRRMASASMDAHCQIPPRSSATPKANSFVLLPTESIALALTSFGLSVQLQHAQL